MRLRHVVLPAIVLGLSFTPAFADTINYTFNAPTLGATATFSLPSNPTPSAVGSNYFQLNNITFTVPGFGNFTGNVDFFNAAAGGGAGSGANRLDGAALFSGSLSSPQLLTGSFPLSGSIFPDSDGAVAVSGTLTATAASVAPVPELPSDPLFATACTGIIAAAWARRRSTES